jgi:O-antigen/teichoic acid export membrane protein
MSMRMRLLRSIRSILRSRLLGQTALFAVSSAIVSLLAAVAKAVIARRLPTEAFGSFSFATAFLLFTAMIFEFGVFLPAARLAAKEQQRGKQEIVGAALIVFVPVGLAFVVTTVALSAVVDDLFHVHAARALALSAPLAFVYPFRQLALWLAQGLDRLHVFAITSVVAQCILIGALGVVAGAGWPLTTTSALVLQSGAFFVGSILFVIWARPVFGRARRRIRALTDGARSYGFQVYLGRVLSVGTYNMDVLMLAAFTNASTVGYYSLAGAIATASGFPVVGFSTALFHRMVRHDQIERRWLVGSCVVGLAAAASAWIFAAPFIDGLFSHRYSPAVGLVGPLALAQAVRGVTGVYNSFLSAQARGRELRNAAFILTSFNIALNFALIPTYGAKGAAWASFVALLANLVAHIFYYRRSIGNRRTPSEPPTATSVVADTVHEA